MGRRMTKERLRRVQKAKERRLKLSRAQQQQEALDKRMARGAL